MCILLLVESLLGLDILSGGPVRYSSTKSLRIGAACRRKSALAIKEATAARRKVFLSIRPRAVVVVESVVHVAGFVPYRERRALFIWIVCLAVSFAKKPALCPRVLVRRGLVKVVPGFVLPFFLSGPLTAVPNRLCCLFIRQSFCLFFLEGSWCALAQFANSFFSRGQAQRV